MAQCGLPPLFRACTPVRVNSKRRQPLRRGAACVYESRARSQKKQEWDHMANGHDPSKPTQNPGSGGGTGTGTGTGTGAGTGTGTGTGSGPGSGSGVAPQGSHKPPQTNVVVAVAAAVGGAVGGVVGALIGSGMHP